MDSPGQMFPHILPAGVEPAAPPGRTVTQVPHRGVGGRQDMEKKNGQRHSMNMNKSALDTFYDACMIEPDIRVSEFSFHLMWHHTQKL